MAHAGSGSIHNQIQLQTSLVCVTSSGPFGLEGRCFESSKGGAGCLCLSPGCNSGTNSHQAFRPKVSQNDLNCAGMAQHAMVLGPGQHVSSNSPLPSKGGELVNSTVQSTAAQGPPQPEATCLAPRATAIQQAGFSDKVATRIEAPQRRSIRAVHESKWTIFVRWCEKNKVDFRSPSIKRISFSTCFRRSSFSLALLMAIELL